MSVRNCSDLKDFARQLRRDMRLRDTRIRNAVRKASRQTRNFVARDTIPKAFGELRDSLYVQDAANGSAVVCDAPHAAAVENGSRPHTPPLGPLIAWVALRGVQGMTENGAVKSNRTRAGRVGDYRKEAARRVAESLSGQLGGRGKKSVYGAIGRTGQWRQRAAFHLEHGNMAALADDPATVAVARRIQMAIKKHGTKPQPYMRAAMPEAEAYLAEFVNDALPDR